MPETIDERISRRSYLKYLGAGAVGGAIVYGFRDLAERYGWISGLTKTVTQTATQTLTKTERETKTVTQPVTQTITETVTKTTEMKSEPIPSYSIFSGEYVDVEWGKFRNYPNVAVWAQRTADTMYLYLAVAQGVPLQHMRRSPIHLDWGIGGWASNGEVGVKVDWFFGKNLVSPSDQGPSAGMTPRDYSLQRLDAELYHELAHNMPIVAREGYRPSWFTEALGTWAQSSVVQPGAYTGIKAQMEDAMWGDNAYTQPDAFGGYGKGTLFLWWLVENYGISGLLRMISQCFGWEKPWASDKDIDVMGFIPWTGKGRNELSEDFKDSIRSGWRADINSLVNVRSWKRT